MYATLLAPAIQATADDGLTLSRILSDVPTDPASLFIYVLLIAAVGGILWAGRSRGGGPPSTA